MISWLNENAGAVTGLATIALVVVTGLYVWLTANLLRLQKPRPRLGIAPARSQFHNHNVILRLINSGNDGASKIQLMCLQPKEENTLPSLLRIFLRDVQCVPYLAPGEILALRIEQGAGASQSCPDMQFRISYHGSDGKRYSEETPVTFALLKHIDQL